MGRPNHETAHSAEGIGETKYARPRKVNPDYNLSKLAKTPNLLVQTFENQPETTTKQSPILFTFVSLRHVIKLISGYYTDYVTPINMCRPNFVTMGVSCYM